MRERSEADGINTAEAPLISVVIPTINRGEAILPTVDSVLNADYPSLDLTIVDQSRNDATELALKPYASRIRYIRSAIRGAAAGRNTGARSAKGTVLAFTDDDCTVPSRWLREIVAVFRADDRIGMLFGNVLAAPHSRKRGFIQAYVRDDAFIARGIRDKHRVEGIGGCMAVRTRVWNELGGFDAQLGAGARFRSAEETDLAVRALLAGHWVCENPRVSVVHHGFRSWEQRPKIVQDYLYGLGAMTAKHLRRHRWWMLKLAGHLAWRWAFGEPVVDLGGRPSRRLRLRAFTEGLAAGMSNPVDFDSGLFIAEPRPDKS